MIRVGTVYDTMMLYCHHTTARIKRIDLKLTCKTRPDRTLMLLDQRLSRTLMLLDQRLSRRGGASRNRRGF